MKMSLQQKQTIEQEIQAYDEIKQKIYYYILKYEYDNIDQEYDVPQKNGVPIKKIYKCHGHGTNMISRFFRRTFRFFGKKFRMLSEQSKNCFRSKKRMKIIEQMINKTELEEFCNLLDKIPEVQDTLSKQLYKRDFFTKSFPVSVYQQIKIWYDDFVKHIENEKEREQRKQEEYMIVQNRIKILQEQINKEEKLNNRTNGGKRKTKKSRKTKQ